LNLFNNFIFSQLGADLFKFSAEIDGRDIGNQIKEIFYGKVDYDEAVRLDPIPFMLQERLRDEFMVMVVY